jgi:hypothetical protein
MRVRVRCRDVQMRWLAVWALVAAGRPLAVPLALLAEAAGLETDTEVRGRLQAVGRPPLPPSPARVRGGHAGRALCCLQAASLAESHGAVVDWAAAGGAVLDTRASWPQLLARARERREAAGLGAGGEGAPG